MKKGKNLINIILGVLLSLFGILIMIRATAAAGAIPFAIGLGLIILSFTKSRVGIVIFGHILITVGAYLITYGIYLVIKFKPEPTFLNIIGLPIFWGIFSIFGGVCSIFHGMCNCVRTFGISIQNEKLKK